MRRLVRLSTVCLAVACGGGGSPSAPVSESIPSAGPEVAQAPEPSAASCPAVPMSLVLGAPGGQSLSLLRLEASGQLVVTGFGGEELRGSLSPEGCLRGPDGLWAELSPSGAVWTLRQRLRAEGEALIMPDGVRHAIASDGKVTRIEHDGSTPSEQYGSVWLRGYRPEGRCAGLLMYTAMLSMMPSMAVSDGAAPRLPLLPDSRCREAGQQRGGVELRVPSPFPKLQVPGKGIAAVGLGTPVDLPLEREAELQGAPPSPLQLREVGFIGETRVPLSRDDALGHVIVVLKGEVLVGLDEDQPPRDPVTRKPAPLKGRELRALQGVSVVGGGVQLESRRSARLLIATVLRADQPSFTERGKPWSTRPVAAQHALRFFDLRKAPRVDWGEGRFAAALALEASTTGEVSPDASLALLGIAPGAEVREHVHDDAWEVLAILRGRGTMKVGTGAQSETIEVLPGAYLRIPRGVPHSFVAGDDEVVALQLYSPPGAEQRFRKLAAEQGR